MSVKVLIFAENVTQPFTDILVTMEGVNFITVHTGTLEMKQKGK